MPKTLFGKAAVFCRRREGGSYGTIGAALLLFGVEEPWPVSLPAARRSGRSGYWISHAVWPHSSGIAPGVGETVLAI